MKNSSCVGCKGESRRLRTSDTRSGQKGETIRQGCAFRSHLTVLVLVLVCVLVCVFVWPLAPLALVVVVAHKSVLDSPSCLANKFNQIIPFVSLIARGAKVRPKSLKFMHQQSCANPFLKFHPILSLIANTSTTFKI